MSKIKPVQPNSDERIRDLDRHHETPAVKKTKKTSDAEKSTALRPLRTGRKKEGDNPFVSLDMESVDMEILNELSTDEATWILTQIYLNVESMIKEDDSVDLVNGLEAIEEQIKLMEYLHKAKTAIIND